jgi:hypothetical protein
MEVTMRSLTFFTFIVLATPSAQAQEAPDDADDTVGETTVYQVCEATDPRCVSVHRSGGTILVTRGSEVVSRVSTATPLPEPAVKIRVLDVDDLGSKRVQVVVEDQNFGPYTLVQGNDVAISRDGRRFALLERRMGKWWLVSDGYSHELPDVAQAMGARFNAYGVVLVDTLHGTTVETIRVSPAAASP